jgi:hypothetical protein
MVSFCAGGSRVTEASPITSGAIVTMPSASDANQFCQVLRNDACAPRPIGTSVTTRWLIGFSQHPASIVCGVATTFALLVFFIGTPAKIETSLSFIRGQLLCFRKERPARARRGRLDRPAPYSFVSSLSPATRSCSSFALLMRYSNSRPL